MTGSNPDNDSAFPATQWSLVARAGVAGTSAAREALAAIIRRYVVALRSHLVCRLAIPADRADDLLQGFILSKVLEDGLVGRADRTKGKFRSFLVRVLDNYVIDEVRRQSAARRGGESAPEALSGAADVVDPALSPPDVLNRAWARQVLATAIENMRGHCQRSGQTVLWEVFETRVLAPALYGSEALDYDALVARFGLRSPSQASNLMITAKRAFARHLRTVVGEYTATAAEADAEIRDLQAILAGGRG